MSLVPEEKLQALAFLIKEDYILSERSLFRIGMLNCVFLRFRVDMNRTLKLIKEFSKLDCQSITQQTWSNDFV
jgi:hypothetical protein